MKAWSDSKNLAHTYRWTTNYLGKIAKRGKRAEFGACVDRASTMVDTIDRIWKNLNIWIKTLSHYAKFYITFSSIRFWSIYVWIQNLQEVRWAHQLNYKIAHIINFAGVIILPTPIPLLGLTWFDYLGIPGTKNTIAKESTTHGMVFGNLPLLAECSREGSAQWLIP